MKLSTKGQYAVMALTDIVRHGTYSPVTLSDIAFRQNLPLPYLEQLFTRLRRKGLVTSVRGNKGGYKLNLKPATVTILDIMEAVEEPIKTTRCSSSSSMSCQGKTERCLTHHLWDGLSTQIEEYLRAVSLEDVCKQNLPHKAQEAFLCA